MIEFVHQWAVILLVFPLLMIWLAPPHKQSQDSLQVPYFKMLADLSGLKPSPAASVLKGRFIQTLVLWLTWICLVLAAAKPEWVGEPIEVKKSARDLMIAVDLSGSMEAEDFSNQQGQKIDRLTAVKQVLQEFAQHREGDRLGLIVFGSAAYLQAPFTNDKTTWITLLNETEIAMAGASTAMGDAMGLAISNFEASTTKNRVLIVLTDGNDTDSRVPPVDAAKIAAAHEVKIYTIAIGDPKTVGEDALDITTLQQIADITGGGYFEAMDRESLQAAYQEIEKLEPQLYESLSYRPRTSLFHYPLALVAIMVSLLLPIMLISGVFYRKKVMHV